MIDEYVVTIRVKASTAEEAVEAAYQLLADGGEPDEVTPTHATADIQSTSAEPESQSSKHCDAGWMNDVRFGTDGGE